MAEGDGFRLDIPRNLWNAEPLSTATGPFVKVEIDTGLNRALPKELRASYIKIKSREKGALRHKNIDSIVLSVYVKSEGTMSHDLVYVFEPVAEGMSTPTILHGGDRAHSGVRSAYPQDGKLVIELFEPDGNGDCCSEHFVRHVFAWSDKQSSFQEVGVPTFHRDWQRQQP